VHGKKVKKATEATRKGSEHTHPKANQNIKTILNSGAEEQGTANTQALLLQHNRQSKKGF
jgi:hypothetical protein